MYERVLFVALILLSAYTLKRIKLLSEDDAKPLIDYVVYFSLPALILDKARDIPIDRDALSVVACAWITIIFSVILSLIAGRLFGLEGVTLRTFLLVSSFGNTAFMGYPFTYALLGEEALKYAILYDQLGSFLLVVSVGFFIATGRLSLKEVLAFPPFIALYLAFFLRGVDLPSFLETFFDVAGSSLIPVVLFAVGLKFSPQETFYSLKESLLAVLLKMLVVPVCTILVLEGLGWNTLPYKVVVLESAMPPMVMAGVLAIKYGLNAQLAVSAITLGIGLSFLTVPAIMALYNL